ncbi:AAA family ATPase [Sulfurimonas sp. ST-25]|uniref:AAA family ATPase n=1 Tax=Sulfurimonas sp. ST-25 TaxID=3400151 RepID=UPI003A8B0282
MQVELFNPVFERAILSSILFDADLFMEYRHLLSQHMFYMPFHRSAYAAMEAVADNGNPVCEEFVAAELEKMGQMNEQMMLEMMSATPISNLAAYIEAVADFAMRRDVIAAADESKRKIVEEHESGQASILALQSTLAKIAETDVASDGIVIRPLYKVAHGETEFILKDWLPMPRGTLSIISAPGGTGKTWLAIQAGIRHAMADPGKRVVLWLSEDPDFESRSRAEEIARIMFGKALDEFPNLDIIDVPPVHMMKNGDLNEAAFYRMKRKLMVYDLIVLDPLLGFYGAKENDNSEARIFMQPFMNWAKERNIVICFLHHSRKGADDGSASTRGAGAIVDACRAVYEADRVYADQRTKDLDESNLHMREITLRKDNYGAIKLLGHRKVLRHTTPRQAAVEVEYTGHMNVTDPELGNINMVVIN